jgi:glycosyltransferase involved in cell wall biosynthesis
MNIQGIDVDISVVIPAHREGRLAHRTLQSVRRAQAYAQIHGVTSEIVVVLDRADSATLSYFREQSDIHLFQVDFGDTGPTRNYGVHQARGRYVNFLDADDLFSRSWLWKAYCAAESWNGTAVWSPQFTVIFETENVVWRHLDTSEPEFQAERLIDVCHWLPANLMRREIALEIPFEECHPETGFGSEDWHWHCELLAAGIPVKVVEDTSLFYRRRPGSRSAFHIQQNAVYRRTRLFDFDGLRSLGHTFPVREVEGTTAPERELMPVGSTSRSAFKAFYRSQLRPRMPEQLDAQLRRLYFGVFPEGAKHWLRTLPKTIQTRSMAGARHGWSTARRASRAAVPAPIRRALRSAYHSWRHAPHDHHLQSSRLPVWLLEDWREAHENEPLIFPSAVRLASTYIAVDPPRSAVGDAYLDVCRQLGEPWPSHVYLVPWLTTGGSDLTALNYVNSLHQQGWAERILVIATEDRDSPWANRLPEGVSFLPFGRLYGQLSLADRKCLLIRLLLQMAPRMIHNLNSFLGYEAFVTHGRALSQASSLLGHVFCYDRTTEGARVGYPVDHVPRCFDVLSAVISDNQSLLDEIHQIYHLDPARLLVHYQPVTLQTEAPPRIASTNEPLKILWAGRLDRQKRVDILNAVARACAAEDFEFHAFGSRVLDLYGPVPTGPNMTYHGPFDGFGQLPSQDFDVLLYTSEWDGLPNVPQEAMARGLVVVASDSGGVKELIRPGKTGYLITPRDDVEAFVSALRSIDRDRVGASRLVKQGYRLLRDQHSRQQFIRALLETPGYSPLPRRSDATAA